MVPMHTDIWSPGVDFVNEFRFAGFYDGSPIPGQPYQFFLLDILGSPIRGTETTDTWTYCASAAPNTFQFLANPANAEDVTFSWVGILDVADEFVPGSIGFYQFGIHPEDWPGSEFGADSMGATPHVIPWLPFNPDDPGSPDGRNVGVSLSEFLDGPYLIDVIAMYEANPAFGGFGHECTVGDSSQALADG